MRPEMFSVFKRALHLLDRRSRRRLGLLVIVQVLLSSLDLLGVLLIGLVAGLSSSALTGGDLQQNVTLPLQIPTLGDTPLTAIIIIASIAAFVLIGKSVLGFILMRRSYRFLARRQAAISSRLAAELLRQPLLDVQKRSTQENSYALTYGVSAATIGVLGSGVLILVETSVFVVLLIGLLFVDPAVGLFTVAFFGAIAFVIQRYLGERGRKLGQRLSLVEVQSLSGMQEALRAHREIFVSGRRDFFAERFAQLRWDSATVQAQIQVMTQLAKYVSEVALVVGAGTLALTQFLTRSTVEAVAVIAIFLAAASRIMPALLRLQGGLFTMRTASGVATTTFLLSDDLADGHGVPRSDPQLRDRCLKGIEGGHQGFEPSVELGDVWLTYPGASRPALAGISLVVPPGQTLALVGPSGAGKTSVADVILGVLEPDAGRVIVGGVAPGEAVTLWPGGVAYVPQDIVLVEGTIRENVALGLPTDCLEDGLILSALDRAHFNVADLSQAEGLDTRIGEGGERLSGGQRQRLGLARAFLTQPRLIVLDEATSSLDAETEFLIGAALRELHGAVTLIVIAHRLSTVKDADKVAYLEDGELRALGSFEEVKTSQANFARQAHLLGL